jgi:hypothetical protein
MILNKVIAFSITVVQVLPERNSIIVQLGIPFVNKYYGNVKNAINVVLIQYGYWNISISHNA